jgi:hypothetical protein
MPLQPRALECASPGVRRVATPRPEYKWLCTLLLAFRRAPSPQTPRVRPLVAPRAQAAARCAAFAFAFALRAAHSHRMNKPGTVQLMISQADAQDLGLFGKYAVTSAVQLLSTRAQFRHSNPIL